MAGEAREKLLHSERAGLRVRVAADAMSACRALAEEIAALVQGADRGSGARSGSNVVLGLATGRTPLGVYAELARLRREAGLSFAHVTTFNLDEYLGLPPEHPAAFRAYVRRHVLEPLGLDPARVHVPEGSLDPARAAPAAEAYERAIEAAGGIDLALLGIGINGHLAFNEPGSPRDSRTRVVELAPATRAANASDFPPGEAVPTHAITVGIATIFGARRLRGLAFGAPKAEIVRRTLEEPVDPALPATFLREHGDAELLLDRPAAAHLPD